MTSDHITASIQQTNAIRDAFQLMAISFDAYEAV
jgi:hypothetical protein